MSPYRGVHPSAQNARGKGIAPSALWRRRGLYFLDRLLSTNSLQRQEATIDEMWEMGRVELQSKLPNVLNPVQLQLLPGQAAAFFTAKSMKGNRVFYFGAPN
jgi:hypothetical protein